MSIEMLTELSSWAKLDPIAEKDAAQKVVEAAVDVGAFASALAQANAAPGATLVSGQRSNAMIPAVLIDLASEDPAATQSAAIVNAAGQGGDATEAFLDFARKTPAEKMRAMVLAEMGLSEDGLRALDAGDRAEIEEKIRIRIEAKVREGMEKTSGIKLNQVSLNTLSS